ncbi:Oxidoreductase family, NAD-binding Rossmann fold [Vibrio aerogenes CECT 7868]|uniref:Oxidoreductase family, NAD-binding Rossmann fold n=1 Tax=Vibrio aerogenes CECT 7868 TaxID=1216006 RepID=A0A1M5Z9A8_9VIBR|nr:Gfo/Idh/MocA family oxidoreductase [Vibrio aerogenes]SHI20807.1 Oxidoreductase family, NAD-binding Rossmann fold [Vibrio aerogenes CECT 7868]
MTEMKPGDLAKPLRVLLCGAAFGEVYLKAIERLPQYFQLAGVMARGSEHSRKIAETHQVPLMTSVDEVSKADFDLACVVIKSGVVGGPGTKISCALMEKEIPVIQEYPLHCDEVVQCIKTSNQMKTPWMMNSFYPDVAPVRRFIEAVQGLRKLSDICAIHVETSIQVLYPLIDILMQSLDNLRPWRFSNVLCRNGPFSVISARFGTIPVVFHIQNQIHPDDPDNYMHVLHRISVTSEDGTLTLNDTHGDVTWSPRAHVPRNEQGYLDMFNEDYPQMKENVLHSLNSQATETPIRYAEVFSQLLPGAMEKVLTRFCHQVVRGEPDRRQQQRVLTTCQCWQALNEALGPTEVINQERPYRLVTVRDLEDAIRDLQ